MPATGNAEGFGENVWPATAITGVAGESIREIIVPSIAKTPTSFRPIFFPSTV